jgi:protein TonB
LYRLEIQVPGFTIYNRLVTVSPALDEKIDANLSVGRTSESVTVSAQRTNNSASATSPAASPQRIQVGGNVELPRRIRIVAPTFPQSARDQGVQGSVTFQALIDKYGFVRGTPLAINDAPADLELAALDAIRQWQYAPARLNGEPIAFLTEITVNFQLQ